ncbi:MAG: antibiotic biosynthesis monooxygenase [Hyphomicrobiales bacterium]|nr:antibiotic biosynthesis monooxygenase [Hyphomicrobiales bacterium]
MIYVIATLAIKPGTLADVTVAVGPCIEATRNEAGCLSYDLNQSLTDENTLVFVEKWKSRADLDQHFKQPHMVEWREKGAQYIDGRNIEIIDAADVEIL